MSSIRNNILQAIGDTPLVRLERVGVPRGGQVLAKLELLNPGGSIKSRPAYAMVRAAERAGLLTPDSIIVEATSGNQGISLCMVGACLGYRVRIVMPASMSRERQLIMKAYGAELVLTDPGADIGQALVNALDAVAELAAADPNVFVPGQFANPANPESHYATTAGEIISQLGPGGRADAFVSGIGTGGSITGAGRALKERYPECLVVAAEPEHAAILSGGTIGHHVQQGIGDGFIPDVLDTSVVDRIEIVTDEQAVAMARQLARREGILAGISSGTNVVVALKLAAELGPGSTVVTLCPDTGERYLSMELLDG